MKTKNQKMMTMKKKKVRSKHEYSKTDLFYRK